MGKVLSSSFSSSSLLALSRFSRILDDSAKWFVEDSFTCLEISLILIKRYSSSTVSADSISLRIVSLERNFDLRCRSYSAQFIQDALSTVNWSSQFSCSSWSSSFVSLSRESCLGLSAALFGSEFISVEISSLSLAKFSVLLVLVLSLASGQVCR